VVVEERAGRSVRGRAVVAVVLLAVSVLLAAGGSQGGLSVAHAVVLGAVEGITEFLPVSSTGHLLVTQRLLDLGTGDGKTAADAYVVAVQIGAIAAVLAIYRQRISSVLGRDTQGRRLAGNVAVAFVPAALLGLAFGDAIKEALFAPWPVIAGWAAGGVFLLLWRPVPGRSAVEQLSLRPALVIGLAQALALWPGVSRSLVTIVAALAVGLSLGAAVEFSFLLGLVTLSAAAVLDLARDGSAMVDLYGWRTPILGSLVAFVTAYVAVRWMVAYLRERPLVHFGVYRLTVAGVAAVLVLAGTIG
jgi:undecaprenyl-diphosphatase